MSDRSTRTSTRSQNGNGQTNGKHFRARDDEQLGELEFSDWYEAPVFEPSSEERMEALASGGSAPARLLARAVIAAGARRDRKRVVPAGDERAGVAGAAEAPAAAKPPEPVAASEPVATADPEQPVAEAPSPAVAESEQPIADEPRVEATTPAEAEPEAFDEGIAAVDEPEPIEDDFVLNFAHVEEPEFAEDDLVINWEPAIVVDEEPLTEANRADEETDHEVEDEAEPAAIIETQSEAAEDEDEVEDRSGDDVDDEVATESQPVDDVEEAEPTDHFAEEEPAEVVAENNETDEVVDEVVEDNLGDGHAPEVLEPAEPELIPELAARMSFRQKASVLLDRWAEREVAIAARLDEALVPTISRNRRKPLHARRK